MASQKPTVVLAALFGNLIVALAKLGAGIVANSSAMLAEAAHSFSDTGNQVLLLVGLRRSKRPVSERYPFGTSKSQYFWPFLVAVLLFGMAGGYSVYEGVQKILHPHPVEDIRLSLLILGIAFVIEAGVLWVAVRKARQQARAAGIGTIRQFVEENRDATLMTVIVEDCLALVGLPVAGLALVLTRLTGDPLYDAAGSLVIGVLLMGFALFLANQVRDLLIGRGLRRADAEAVRDACTRHTGVHGLKSLQTMHLGPDAVLLGAEVIVDPALSIDEVAALLVELEAEIRHVVPATRYVFLEPHVGT